MVDGKFRTVWRIHVQPSASQAGAEAAALTGDGSGGNLGLSLGDDRLRGADNLGSSAAASLHAAGREGLDAEDRGSSNGEHYVLSV